MTKTQLSTQLIHHLTMGMESMISDYGLWKSKPSYYMIEQEEGDNLTIFSICRNFLNPFFEIIYGYDDVTMTPR